MCGLAVRHLKINRSFYLKKKRFAEQSEEVKNTCRVRSRKNIYPDQLCFIRDGSTKLFHNPKIIINTFLQKSFFLMILFQPKRPIGKKRQKKRRLIR